MMQEPTHDPGLANEQSNLNIAFLDVGQGDSTVIILPDSLSAILIDCPENRVPVVFDFLEAYGIQVINSLSQKSPSDCFNQEGMNATLITHLA